MVEIDPCRIKMLPPGEATKVCVVVCTRFDDMGVFLFFLLVVFPSGVMFLLLYTLVFRQRFEAMRVLAKGTTHEERRNGDPEFYLPPTLVGGLPRGGLTGYVLS